MILNRAEVSRLRAMLDEGEAKIAGLVKTGKLVYLADGVKDQELKVPRCDGHSGTTSSISQRTNLRDSIGLWINRIVGALQRTQTVDGKRLDRHLDRVRAVAIKGAAAGTLDAKLVAGEGSCLNQSKLSSLIRQCSSQWGVDWQMIIDYA